MSDVTSWFDHVDLKRNPHAPMIQDALDNGYPVTEEMLWGRKLTDKEIAEKRHELLEKLIKEWGIPGDRARAALRDFEGAD